MITTPFNSGPSCILIGVDSSPTMAPPHILAFRSISAAPRTNADRVGRIGAHEDEVRIGGLHRAHHRHEVGREWRIALVVDDGEPDDLALSRVPSQVVRPNSASAATIATLLGLGLCAIATSNQPREKASVPSLPPGIIEKYLE